MLDDITRLSPKYTGVGTKTFAFSFRIFALTDIYVKLAASSTAGTSTTLTKDTDYTVTANLNTQETTPGGSITLIGDYAGGLTSGQVLVIGSKVPYTQTTQLTNFSKFPPEIINTALDRIVAEVQQIKERQNRTVTLDETDSRSPTTIVNELFEARDTAVTKAAEAAASATSAATAVSGFDTHVETKKTEITTLANTKKTEISTLTESKKAELEALAELIESGWGYVCQEQTWTTDADISANTEVTLPNGMKYIVGNNHLRLSMDGIQLVRGQNYTEVGTTHAFGTKFKPTFDIPSGTVMNAWAGTLGQGEIESLVTRVGTLESSLAELSQTVVYRTDED